MLSRKRIRSVAKLILGVLLFAQAAFAAAVCELTQGNPVQAIAQSERPCHQPETNANLCVSHCLAPDQSLDQPAPFVLSIPVGGILVLTPTSFPAVLSRSGRETVKADTGPPFRILFHRFLI